MRLAQEQGRGPGSSLLARVTRPDGLVFRSWIDLAKHQTFAKLMPTGEAPAKAEGWQDPHPTSAPRFDVQPRQFGGVDDFAAINDPKAALALFN
jgi:hypothetical protein